MSLLFRGRKPTVESRAFVTPPLPGFLGGLTDSGQVIVPDNACRSAAVAACRRVIVSSIVGLPVETFAVRDGRQIRISDPAVVRSPSTRLRRRGFLAQLVNSLVLHGNAYAMITGYDALNRPSGLEVLHWSQVQWSNGEPWVNGATPGLWPVGELLVIQATSWLKPGSPLAESPVDLAKQSIGAGLAAEQFGAQFFADGAFPSSLIYSANEETVESAQAIKNSVMNSIRGTREPAVLGAGLKWEPMSVNPSDSQFIDLQRFEIEQCARFFGIPPQMIYAAVSGQAVTYANASQADLVFLKYSLKPWLEDLEEAWSALLPNGQMVRMNVDDLLRMDASVRHKDQQIRLQSMTATVNEIRQEEDKPPFEKLDDDGANVYDLPGIPNSTAAGATLDSDGDEMPALSDSIDGAS